MNLKDIKSAYLIGIKGSGMAALAEILMTRGVSVTGSDTTEKFFTDAVLEKMGIGYFEGFSEKNVPKNVDVIVYSSAYNASNNPEMQEAERKNMLLVSYAEMLGVLLNGKYGVAVCGTHGKTTTTALLGSVLVEAKKDPTVVVGGKVKNWGSNARSGKGDFFAVEADEYQNHFSNYNPQAVILTSLDFDHPDFFSDFSEYKKAFKVFLERLPLHGLLAVWGDSVDTLEVAESARCRTVTYGFGEKNDYRITDYRIVATMEATKIASFHVVNKDSDLGEFKIQLPGKHNALNAAGVIAFCHMLRIDMEAVRKGLADFQGTARRFDYIGKRNGAILIDDYGHHPDELKATFKAARELYADKKITAVFHPHTFTRTQALLKEFSQSFGDVDEAIVLDVYGSAREKQGGISSQDLVREINRFTVRKAQHIATIPEAVEHLKNRIGANDIVISIGAGDVWKVAEELKEK